MHMPGVVLQFTRANVPFGGHENVHLKTISVQNINNSQNNFSKKYQYSPNDFSKKYQYSPNNFRKNINTVRTISVRNTSTVRMISIVNNSTVRTISAGKSFTFSSRRKRCATLCRQRWRGTTNEAPGLYEGRKEGEQGRKEGGQGRKEGRWTRKKGEQGRKVN